MGLDEHESEDRRRAFPVWYVITDKSTGSGSVDTAILVAMLTGNSQPFEGIVRTVARVIADRVTARGLTPGPEAWREIEDLGRAECVAAGLPLATAGIVH